MWPLKISLEGPCHSLTSANLTMICSHHPTSVQCWSVFSTQRLCFIYSLYVSICLTRYTNVTIGALKAWDLQSLRKTISSGIGVESLFDIGLQHFFTKFSRSTPIIIRWNTLRTSHKMPFWILWNKIGKALSISPSTALKSSFATRFFQTFLLIRSHLYSRSEPFFAWRLLLC